MWVRVDNRLVHGQVIEGWLPYTQATQLVVVNDELAGDFLRQQIMSLAVPREIDVHFACLRDAASVVRGLSGEVFVLLETLQDAVAVAESGVAYDVLNIGNLHYAPGKRQVLPHVALSEEDSAALRAAVTVHGMRLDFRAVPTQGVKVEQDDLF